jgi:hypothetical protein
MLSVFTYTDTYVRHLQLNIGLWIGLLNGVNFNMCNVIYALLVNWANSTICTYDKRKYRSLRNIESRSNIRETKFFTVEKICLHLFKVARRIVEFLTFNYFVYGLLNEAVES